MMMITAEGDVSITQCFKAILSSLQEDYHENTLTQLPPAELKAGLSYIKHYGKTRNTMLEC